MRKQAKKHHRDAGTTPSQANTPCPRVRVRRWPRLVHQLQAQLHGIERALVLATTDLEIEKKNLETRPRRATVGRQLPARQLRPAHQHRRRRAGYKNLLEAERGFRDLKSTLLFRPVFHRLEHRIPAHVLICWLALLLTQVAEHGSDQTWLTINRQLGRISQVTLAGPAGTVVQTTRPSPGRRPPNRHYPSNHRPGSPRSTPPDQDRNQPTEHRHKPNTALSMFAQLIPQ